MSTYSQYGISPERMRKALREQGHDASKIDEMLSSYLGNYPGLKIEPGLPFGQSNTNLDFKEREDGTTTPAFETSTVSS